MTRQIRIRKPKTSTTQQPGPRDPGAGLDTRTPSGGRLPN